MQGKRAAGALARNRIIKEGQPMRFTTGAIIVGSLIVIIALAIYLRVEQPAEVPPPASSRAAGGVTRGSGVEERLSRLRADYEERREDLNRLEASEPELPPRAQDAAAKKPMGDLEEWRETVLHDPDPDERAGAILMLSGEDDPETLDVLTHAMNDSDAEVRLAAVEALGDFSDELNPDVLLPAMQDPDPEVRFEAVGILGDMESEEALRLVFDSLNDPDEDVRSLAEGIIELADPPPPRTIQDVQRMVRERDKAPSRARQVR